MSVPVRRQLRRTKAPKPPRPAHVTVEKWRNCFILQRFPGVSLSIGTLRERIAAESLTRLGFRIRSLNISRLPDFPLTR
jgi:hypothetical protein